MGETSLGPNNRPLQPRWCSGNMGACHALALSSILRRGIGLSLVVISLRGVMVKHRRLSSGRSGFDSWRRRYVWAQAARICALGACWPSGKAVPL
jgi:hypothetical protein